MARKDIYKHKDEIKQWVNENKSKAFICKQLNCKQDTLNRYLKHMGIEYNGNQPGKGEKKKHAKWNLKEYLVNSKNIQSNKIRNKILEEKIKPHKCECCGNSEWMGQPIPLELHHKDGNKYHNDLNNYLLLCPNCHTFTDSYRGRNCRKNKCVEAIHQPPKL